MNVQEPAGSATAAKKRVLLIDDHPVVRQGLAQILNTQNDMCVCGEAGDPSSAITAADSLAPDIALVDLMLGEADGLDVVKALKVRHRRVPSLVFSMGDETRYAERALRSGARGYVMKSEPAETLLAAIRRVLSGAVFVSEAMATQLLSNIADGNTDTDPVSRLSQREFEVFRLIGQGLGPTAVAQRLGVSVKTVETYRENIKAKLKLTGARDLIRRAMQHVAPA